MKYINLKDFDSSLLTVEKPSRYVGGEYGRLAKPQALLQTVISFPDLYEIGMSNQALHILYNRINKLPDISCDRVFAPAPDFEKLIKEKKIPLYGLDTGIPLCSADILLFTFGYELGINGILTILDSADVPILSCNRNNKHPIVIAGGPCVSNPIPYSNFIDAFWIGEAEDEFFILLETLCNLKQKGAGKKELFDKISEHKSIWVKGKDKSIKNIDENFSERPAANNVFPLPSMRIVQHHGAVEIMRGCPNGCRFCHAGIWYRPMRQKKLETIKSEVSNFINIGGFREISLSSLSSGDYSNIVQLLEELNNEHSKKHISFQLPSLHISTFSLDILKKISTIRKSGLTFAVETPLDMWQLAINKQITLSNIREIILEAKKNGWRTAKFYFMIGLPIICENYNIDEPKEIISFIQELSRASGLKFNINVGLFIPKPHTPYQWAKQLSMEEAFNKLWEIKEGLRKSGHKVSFQDTLVSTIEGLLARGDNRVGDLIEESFKAGCRLDAWNEYINKDVWKTLLEKYDYVLKDVLKEKNVNDHLPWDCIDTITTKSFLKKELNLSNNNKLTTACEENCKNNCGVCSNKRTIKKNKDVITQIKSTRNVENTEITDDTKDPDTNRILFSFVKKSTAIYISHLSIIEIFSMAFQRASIPVVWTQGYNPLPKLDFASPVSIGIVTRNEIASIDISGFIDVHEFKNNLNKYLPDGMEIVHAELYHIKQGQKKYSPASLLWGFEYETANGTDIVPKDEEKQYKKSIIDNGDSPLSIKRKYLLAKVLNQNTDNKHGGGFFDIRNKTDEKTEVQYDSFFNVYKNIYQNKETSNPSRQNTH
ncbi:B12-binding protein [Spirochaetia bacterium]|nr:B12-binding protein [Spirochaetia bacterium]